MYALYILYLYYKNILYNCIVCKIYYTIVCHGQKQNQNTISRQDTTQSHLQLLTTWSCTCRRNDIKKDDSENRFEWKRCVWYFKNLNVIDVTTDDKQKKMSWWNVITNPNKIKVTIITDAKSLSVKTINRYRKREVWNILC